MEAIVPPKRRVQLNGLHGVISQKMILLKNRVFTKEKLDEIVARLEHSFQKSCRHRAEKTTF
jgi:hypothetical protein